MGEDKIMGNVFKIPKGLQFFVLHHIHILGHNASSAMIRERVSEHLGEAISSSKISVALQRLSSGQFITSAFKDVYMAAGHMGRRRRIYRLTEKGVSAIQAGLRLYGVGSGDDHDVSGEDMAIKHDQLMIRSIVDAICYLDELSGSRALSLTRERLEEALMWGNKAVSAIDDD